MINVNEADTINETLAAPGTEYSFTLPVNTKRFRMKLLETNVAFRYAFVAGKVVAGAVYTVNPGAEDGERDFTLPAAMTIYVAYTHISLVNLTLEVQYWT